MKIRDFFMAYLLAMIPIIFVMTAICSISESNIKTNVIKIVTKK